MLKEVADIRKRCENVEKAADEKLVNPLSLGEKMIYCVIAQTARGIKVNMILDIFAEHVRNNLETVRTFKIGTDEADEYIKSLMGDTLKVWHDINGTSPNYFGISVLGSTFALKTESFGKEWETIATNIKPYNCPFAPEDIESIVTEVYNKAEDIGKRRLALESEDSVLRAKYPQFLQMISFAEMRLGMKMKYEF